MLGLMQLPNMAQAPPAGFPAHNNTGYHDVLSDVGLGAKPGLPPNTQVKKETDQLGFGDITKQLQALQQTSMKK